jgi:hypothetical protein
MVKKPGITVLGLAVLYCSWELPTQNAVILSEVLHVPPQFLQANSSIILQTKL